MMQSSQDQRYEIFFPKKTTKKNKGHSVKYGTWMSKLYSWKSSTLAHDLHLRHTQRSSSFWIFGLGSKEAARGGQTCQPQSGAIAWDWRRGNFWLNDNIYVTCENGAKISSISHSNGPILVGQLRESQAKWVRVGKPECRWLSERTQKYKTLSLWYCGANAYCCTKLPSI